MRLLALALTALIVANLAIAHTGATGIVKERMDAMSSIAKAMRSLSQFMSGARPYNAEVIGTAATSIAKQSGDAMVALFPQGSGGHPSEALDNVWTEREEFTRLANRLLTASLLLEMAAPEGHSTGDFDDELLQSILNGDVPPTPELAAGLPVKNLIGEMGQTCKMCHTRFRM